MKPMTVLAVVLSATCWSASLQADLFHFSKPFGPTNADLGAPMVLTLPQFNPALGVLQSVKVSIKAYYNQGVIEFDNETEEEMKSSFGIGAKVTLDVGLFLPQIIVNPMASHCGCDGEIPADDDGPADFQGADWLLVDALVHVNSDEGNSSIGLNDPNLNNFYGVGQFALSLSSQTDFDLPAPIVPLFRWKNGFHDGVLFGWIDGTVHVEYEYVPEASSLALVFLASTAMGAAFIQRNRQRRTL